MIGKILKCTSGEITERVCCVDESDAKRYMVTVYPELNEEDITTTVIVTFDNITLESAFELRSKGV